MTPASFIPVVGNLLMPVAGVPLGFVAAGWFLFSVGLAFWLMPAPVLTHRMFVADALPPTQPRAFSMLLAPPSVGGLPQSPSTAGGSAP